MAEHLIRPRESPETWDAYVAAHPRGSVFHTSAMHEVFDALLCINRLLPHG